MSLYGLHGEEIIRKMFEHLAALQKLYIESEAPSFFGDNLIALYRNMTFMFDEAFTQAFSAAITKGAPSAELLVGLHGETGRAPGAAPVIE